MPEEGEGRAYQLVGMLTPSGTVMTLQPPCNTDPCVRHGVCHCECPCMPDGNDNCVECIDIFEED